MKLKVCGMKDPVQIEGLDRLGVDFVGFIFYPNSRRYVGGLEPIDSPAGLKRVGVFVNTELEKVVKVAKRWRLDYLQLHGEEDPEYCRALKAKGYSIIKVFGVERGEDFEGTRSYEEVCECFLFDTKGKKRGGNGYAFDWNLLKAYEGSLSYFLSGGIGVGNEKGVLELAERDHRLVAVDLNSRFERGAGDKDLGLLGVFVEGVKREEL